MNQEDTLETLLTKFVSDEHGREEFRALFVGQKKQHEAQMLLWQQEVYKQRQQLALLEQLALSKASPALANGNLSAFKLPLRTL